MPIQNIYLEWGTWINGLDMTGPSHGGAATMKVGGHTDNGQTAEARPLFKLDSDAFSGQIVSASLNLYASQASAGTNIMAYRVIRASNANATWQSSGLSDWQYDGCDNPNTDRSYTALFSAWYLMNTTGWHSIPIAEMTELNSIISGLYTLILLGSSTNYTASIAKSPAPYLAIEYTTSLVGGIQIF